MAVAQPDPLDKAWRSTCRVLFGSEVGPLSDFADWLKGYDEEIRKEKSSISGKSVSFSQNDYSHGARFSAFDEVDFGKKFTPLSINDVKDIDSVSQAVQERLYYTGNVILGNSSHVYGSSNVIDSHYIETTTVINDCKYVGYSRYVHYSDHCFGMLGAEKDAHCVMCMGSELARCFECHMVEVLQDCYYCAKAQNCHDCFFCFGTRNAAYAVGNTRLPRDKYLQIKAKLTGEIAETLRKDKRIFSLLSLIEKSSQHAPDRRLKIKPEKPLPFDIAPIEAAFTKTSAILFGKQLMGMKSYEKFLQKHVPKNRTFPSPFSGQPSFACGYRMHLLPLYKIEKRLPTEEEMLEVGKNEGLSDLSGELSMDLDDLAKRLHPVAYMNLDKIAGNNRNFYDCPVIIDSQDCCAESAAIRSKKCAHCFWTSDAEAIFGSCATRLSSFCMKNFYCKSMQRAFECDGCDNCADSYFLHNCENVRDSMFCFNAKNLTFAIGNASLPPDQYRRIKAGIVSQLADELEGKKDIALDIFNVGARER